MNSNNMGPLPEVHSRSAHVRKAANEYLGLVIAIKL